MNDMTNDTTTTTDIVTDDATQTEQQQPPVPETKAQRKARIAAEREAARAAAAAMAMPKLPKMPRKPKAADMPCGCGCGKLVARRFAPGHDATLHAWVLRVNRGVIKASDIPHAGLKAAVIKAIGSKASAA
jgi:hypothetical protein